VILKGMNEKRLWSTILEDSMMILPHKEEILVDSELIVMTRSLCSFEFVDGTTH
jgi:hypothetical protein